MKIGQCTVTNFGSYPQLSFNYSDQGLVLIHGPTGSGKSTLQDAACWCLYGITAKGGGVDDVKSWANPNDYTSGRIEVDGIEIYRFRGKGKNDLYWMEDGREIRGKDISDTQRLIENRLGVSADLYLLGAYFHEFSLSGAFFTSKAKDRRQVFEQVANLSLPTRISERSAAKRKDIKKIISDLDTDIADTKGGIRQTKVFIRQISANVISWKNTQLATLKDLAHRSDTFEDDKANLLLKLSKEKSNLADECVAIEPSNLPALRAQYDALSGYACETCGAPTRHEERDHLKDAIHTEERKRLRRDQLRKDFAAAGRRYEDAKSSSNVYRERLYEEKNRINPYSSQAEKLGDELFSLEDKLAVLEDAISIKNSEFDALVTISDLADSLRVELLSKSIGAIQELTNRRLESYFDAELRVTFELSGFDNLEVSLFKSGNACKYSQLSKGQRGMLKLCFSTALMSIAANNAGVHFSAVYLDEALDGLDSELKVKAYGLLEELSLEHESVFVIDHSEELKQLFSKKYQVTLTDSMSTLSES